MEHGAGLDKRIVCIRAAGRILAGTVPDGFAMGDDIPAAAGIPPGLRAVVKSYQA
jgi:hypothetical protein